MPPLLRLKELKAATTFGRLSHKHMRQTQSTELCCHLGFHSSSAVAQPHTHRIPHLASQQTNNAPAQHLVPWFPNRHWSAASYPEETDQGRLIGLDSPVPCGRSNSIWTKTLPSRCHFYLTTVPLSPRALLTLNHTPSLFLASSFFLLSEVAFGSFSAICRTALDSILSQR